MKHVIHVMINPFQQVQQAVIAICCQMLRLAAMTAQVGRSLPGNRVSAHLLIRWPALLYLRLIQSILALIQSSDGCNGAVQYPPCCICGQVGLDCASSPCPARIVSDIGDQPGTLAS